MKKITLTAAIAATIACSLSMSSCIGSFALTNQVLRWNNQVGSKFLNEVVFFAFWVLPVYEVSIIADAVVINSIEFWSGTNPLEASHKVIDTDDGRYLVDCDGKGYTITLEGTDQSMRLEFEDDTWSLVDDGISYPLMTFIDDSHVAAPGADGTMRIVPLDRQGLMAYEAEVSSARMLTASR